MRLAAVLTLLHLATAYRADQSRILGPMGLIHQTQPIAPADAQVSLEGRVLAGLHLGAIVAIWLLSLPVFAVIALTAGLLAALGAALKLGVPARNN
jgi:hypothetical protein